VYTLFVDTRVLPPPVGQLNVAPARIGIPAAETAGATKRQKYKKNRVEKSGIGITSNEVECLLSLRSSCEAQGPARLDS
jgi:hypothetical protein